MQRLGDLGIRIADVALFPDTRVCSAHTCVCVDFDQDQCEPDARLLGCHGNRVAMFGRWEVAVQYHDPLGLLGLLGRQPLQFSVGLCRELGRVVLAPRAVTRCDTG